MSVVLDVVCVCVLDVLIDGGVGVCVDVMLCGEQVVVFFVCYDGCVYGYLNCCVYVLMEFDWVEG